MSLLDVLDVTKTAMGGRLLHEWLLRPLADREDICKRHDAVDAFVQDRSLLHGIREALTGVRDLERLIGRLGAGSGNARDLRSLAVSLTQLPEVHSPISENKTILLKQLSESIDHLPDLVELIDKAIVEEPPVTIMEGGLIKSGYRPELDELRDAATEGKQWLASFQAQERERTGIKNLKIRHNRVFGYYIEISKGQLANVPSEYVRKQTLVNAERFITPEIKEYEQRIVGAQERSTAMEYDIFIQVREAVVLETDKIQATAGAVADYIPSQFQMQARCSPQSPLPPCRIACYHAQLCLQLR